MTQNAQKLFEAQSRFVVPDISELREAPLILDSDKTFLLSSPNTGEGRPSSFCRFPDFVTLVLIDKFSLAGENPALSFKRQPITGFIQP